MIFRIGCIRAYAAVNDAAIRWVASSFKAISSGDVISANTAAEPKKVNCQLNKG
jgi:hypothetical protein